MNRKKKLVRATVAIALAFLLVPGEMLSMAGVLPDEEGYQGLLGRDLRASSGLVPSMESTFEGGGPLVYFADDMSQQTREHYEGIGVSDYYGGAVPAQETGPGAWRHDPLRWGIDAPEGTQPWRHVESHSLIAGTWHFGQEGPTGFQYGLLGGESGAVTPLIDLRAVAKVDESEEVFMDSGEYETPIGTIPDVHVSERASVEAPEAAAALRVRHAYEFNMDSEEQLLDGARVEYSILDPYDGWTDWDGLQPVDWGLRVGEDNITARMVGPGDTLVSARGNASSDVELEPGGLPNGVDPDMPTLSIDVDYAANVTIAGPGEEEEAGRQGDYVRVASNETGGPGDVEDGEVNEISGPSDVEIGEVNESRPAPWLYQGPVVSAPEDWRGFGGTSAGVVDSVFDLSGLAGNMVRLRFVTATEQPAAVNMQPLAGWIIDELEVTGIGEPGIDVLEMVLPGDGAILDADHTPDFHPTVLLHNRERTPTNVLTEFEWLDEDVSATNTATLGSGPMARALVSTDQPISELAGVAPNRVHRVEVTATPIAGTLGTFSEIPVPSGASTRMLSHFTYGPGGGIGGSSWRVTDLEIVPLGDAEDRGRLISRGQPVEIRATLANLESTPTTLRLDESGIHPVFRNARGDRVETAEPVQEEITLPVTRDVSPAFGDPNALTEVRWIWPGTAAAQPLEVTLEIADGEVLLQGGRILVDSADSDAARIEILNPWNLGDPGRDDEDARAFPNDCSRLERLQGESGIVRCRSGDALASPVRAIRVEHLGRGAEYELQLTHRGAPFTVNIHGQSASGPPGDDRPSPIDATAWKEPFAQHGVKQSTGWKVSRFAGELDAGCQDRGCWIFMSFHGNGGPSQQELWSLSEVLLHMDGAPLEWETFRVDLMPQGIALQAQDLSEKMVWLHGRDELPSQVNLTVGGHRMIDQGEPDHLPGLEPEQSPSYPSSRLTEDSVYMVGPVSLNRGRPALTFDHWYALGSGGRATVEIAQSIDGIPLGWEEIAIFEGELDLPPSTQNVHVDLKGYMDLDEVFLRFRYTIEPPADFGWDGWGWFLEQIRLEGQDPEKGHMEKVLMPLQPDAGLEQENTAWLEEFDAGLDTGARVSRALEDPHASMEFSEAMRACATPTFDDRYGRGPILVTDPVDLRASVEPILELEHYGALQARTNTQIQVMYDLEYQVMASDGSWPSEWQRATPHTIDPDRNAQKGNGLRDPQGNHAGAPFYEFGVSTDPEDPWKNTFYLGDLAENIVRFRLHVWSYIYPHISTSSSNSFNCINTHLHINEFRIRERDHIVDAATTRIIPDPDRNDLDAIRLLSPEAAAQAAGVDAVVSDERFNVFAMVANEGAIDLSEVRVRMGAVYLDGDAGEGLDIEFIDEDGAGHIDPVGVLRDLVPLRHGGEERQARFSIDAARAEPGRYELTAMSQAVHDTDTNPLNDIQRLTLLVAPYRSLEVDMARTTATPFAAPAQADRHVDVTVVNRGNVDETNVTVRAELVERTGLTSVEPVELTGDGFGNTTISLSKRDGFARIPLELNWEDHLQNLTTGEPILKPGGTYGVLVTIDPEDDSVKWGDEPLEATDEVDLFGTRNLIDLSSGREFFIPFLVEDRILWSDFADRGSSLVEETFPFDAEWTPETYLEGEQISEGESEWVPRWELKPASEVAVDGESSGNAWVLPPYEGVEAVEQVLVSAPMPGHVISAQSRAVLDLQYAHDMPEGQAVVEYRNLRWNHDESKWDAALGERGEWSAVDSTRAGRVAVVVPPDFPRVAGSWIEPYPIFHVNGDDRSYSSYYDGTRPGAGGDYQDRGPENHPWPPFYQQGEEGAWGAVSCSDPENPHDRCAWTPFPAQDPEGDPEWVEALNKTLSLLANELGPENVGLFTTLGDEFGLDTHPPGAKWPGMTLRVPDEQTGGTFDFPLNDLDYLGARLDSYGALLFLGDNATTVFADHSDHLRRMAHDEENDAYYRSLALRGDDPSGLRTHHEEVHAILRAAVPAGIRVIGAIGPATGTIALSGIAEGQGLAAWQTPPDEVPGNPNAPLYFHDGQLRCTIDNLHTASRVQNYPHQDRTLTDVHMQPKEMCEYHTGISFPGVGPVVDPAYQNPFNYWYFSPQDARSLAVRDFIEQGGATPVANVPVWESQADPAGPRFITAAQPEETIIEDWIRRTMAELDRAAGRLEAGSGAWEGLPSTLAFHYAGEFERGPDGKDRFIGNPAQFRIRIQADPEVGGHGFFALDRFGLLGSPLENDIAVRFIEPRDRGFYAPGDISFEVQVEVTNRGINHSEEFLSGLVTVSETTGDCEDGVIGHCTWLEPGDTWESPFTIADPLPGGGQRIVSLDGMDNGRFPDRADRDQEPASEFLFQVALDEDHEDHDAFNDADRAVAHGLQKTAVHIVDMDIDPSQAAHADRVEEGFNINLQLANLGTQNEAVQLRLSLEAARPLDCYDPDNPFTQDPQDDPSAPYHACYPDRDRSFTPIPLNRPADNRLTLLRDSILDVTIPITGLDELDIPPGVWHVVAELELRGLQVTLADRELRWLNLADDSVDPDGAWAAQHFTVGTSDLVYTVNITASHGDWRRYSGSGGDWQVPPEGHDFAAEGGALIANGTRHRGIFGPNEATLVESDDEESEPLSHGWSYVEGEEDTGPFGGPRLVWSRDVRPSSTEEEVICSDHTGAPGPCNNRRWGRQDAANLGKDDFGPDWIVWQPEFNDGSPMSLSAFEDPVLRLLTRYQATEGTGFVVEAQVPKRSCSNYQTFTPPDEHEECRWEWSWSTGQTVGDRGSHEWVSLTGSHTGLGPGLPTIPVDCRATGTDDNPPYTCWIRKGNPLGQKTGIWGQSSQGIHPESDWQIVEYDLTSLLEPGGALYEHCVEARDSNRNTHRIRTGDLSTTRFPSEHPFDEFLPPKNHPCLYAWSNGYWDDDEKPGDPIPRPIRFRFIAASPGVEEGFSRWDIKGASLGDHRLHFEESTREATMTDNDQTVVPFRLSNPSRVPDEVTLSWAFPATYDAPDDVTAGIGLRPLGDDFQDEVTVKVPPRSTVPVYVRLDVGLEHLLGPDITSPLLVILQAQSDHDPTALTQALIEGQFTTRPWGNLEAHCITMNEDDRCDSPAQASVGVPMSVTLRWRNSGDVPIGGPDTPILIRLVEEQLDPETGEVIARSVAHDSNGEPAQRLWEEPVPTFRQSRSDEHVTLEWDPPDEGVFNLLAKINLPKDGDGIKQIPESNYAGNAMGREVHIGPVRLSDVRVNDAWLATFDTRERVDRLIDGHWYVVEADVVNRGQANARDFSAEFRFGAADPFSRSFRESFPGNHHEETFTSSPWRARLQADGSNEWAFAVDVSTITPSETVEDQSLSWEVAVDSYTLSLTDAPRNLTLYPDQETLVKVNVTNTGNAPATPRAWLAEPHESVAVQLTESKRLEAGETKEFTLAVATDNNLTEDARLPGVFFGLLEDPLRKLPLRMDLDPVTVGLPQAAAHPVTAAPGPTGIPLGIVNNANSASTWRIVNATFPLIVETWTAHVRPYSAERVDADIHIQNGTLPGGYRSEVKLEVEVDDVIRRFTIPVDVHVEPEPRFEARLARDDQTVVQGIPGFVLAIVENTGNVPIHYGLDHEVDDGSIQIANQTHSRGVLQPGETRTQELRITGASGSRHVLGETRANWTWQETGEEGIENVTWRVAFESRRVELESTGLDALRLRPGEEAQVPVTVENPMEASVEAEILVAVDGVVHSVRHVALAPLGQSTVLVPFTAGSDGERHDVMVIVRPAGATVDPTDAVFYAIGGTDSLSIVVEEESGLFTAVPGPSVVILLIVLLFFTGNQVARRKVSRR